MGQTLATMVYLKTEKEIEIMKEGGEILAQIMAEVALGAKPGISTNALENIASEFISSFQVKPAFLGHEGFPSVLCASLNEEIVHNIPSEKKFLKEGDVLKLDLGIVYDEFNLDMAVTLGIGKISAPAQKLIEAGQDSLNLAIQKIKPGIFIEEIGKTIWQRLKKDNFNVVRDLCGHGIGRKLHEDPKIFNFVLSKDSKDFHWQELKLEEGMVLCVEPMLTAGDWRLEKTRDGFGYKTKDNSLTAHFEHTIAVVKNGCQVLTSNI